MTGQRTAAEHGGAWLRVPAELLERSRAALSAWAESVRAREPYPWVAMDRWERDDEHTGQPDDAALDRDEATALLRWHGDGGTELASRTFGPIESLAVAEGWSPVPLSVPRPTALSARALRGGGVVLAVGGIDSVHLTSANPGGEPLLAPTVVLAGPVRDVHRASAAGVRCLAGPGVSETAPELLARFLELERLHGAIASEAILRIVAEMPRLRALELWAPSEGSADLGALRLPRLERVRLRGFSLTDVREFLKAHPALESVDVRTPDRGFSLRDLGVPVGTKELRLSGCRGLVALDDVDVVRPLRRLHVAGCLELQDLATLREARSLVQLDISACRVVPHTRPLAELTELAVLRADDCPRIGAPDRLVLPPNLVHLVLGTAARLPDARPLASLSRLRTLSLRHCARLRSLTGLEATMATLEQLVLDDCESLEDLTALAHHRVLEELSLRGCSSVRDLAPLAGLRALKRLDVRRCRALPREAIERSLPSLEVLRSDPPARRA